MAYSGLAQGLLTGELTRDTTFPEGDQRPTTVLFQPGVYERCLDAVDTLRPIAARASLTVPQLAIAWLLSRPGMSTVLVGARTVPEIEENVVGADTSVSLALPCPAPRTCSVVPHLAAPVPARLPRVNSRAGKLYPRAAHRRLAGRNSLGNQ